jgi:hypothetical protein
MWGPKRGRFLVAEKPRSSGEIRMCVYGPSIQSMLQKVCLPIDSSNMISCDMESPQWCCVASVQLSGAPGKSAILGPLGCSMGAGGSLVWEAGGIVGQAHGNS